MALEDLTGSDKFIDDLVETNPVGSTDTLNTADDHIKGIKNVLKNCFEFITGAVTATHTELNQLDGNNFTSAIQEAKGNDIASATTTDIGAATGNFVDITGTTTITGLGTVQAGTRRTVQFDGSLTLTYNATSLILPGDADIVTQAGDVAKFVSLGSGNWICTKYQRDEATIHPGPISGYVSGITEYVEDDVGADTASFDIGAAIGATFESVGPTGSGATNTWTALDSIPTGTSWVDLIVTIELSSLSANKLTATLNGRKTGSSAAVALLTRKATADITYPTTAGICAFSITTSFRVPIDSSGRFDLAYSATGTDTTTLYLVGWGV